MRAFFILCLILLLSPVYLNGQGSLAEKKRQAKEFFLNAHYLDAYQILQTAQKNNQIDRESNFLMALCLYQLNRLNEAETILQDLVSDKSAYLESWLYLGRIFHDRHEFLKATEYYKAYLKRLSANDPNRADIRAAIRRCSNGIRWQYRQPLAIVENLGSEVNTTFDEFGPIISPNDPGRLYFSSARPGSSGGPRNRNGQPDEIMGRYTCDIFHTQLTDGVWKKPMGLSYLVNSPKHEVVFDFAPSGSSMYYFKGNNFSQGQIFIDSFRAGSTNILSSDVLYSPIDALSGISAPHFVNDTLVIFPSQRPGGYGGLDLYRIEFSNGHWSTPQNMGPEINSSFDETTPFLARDGKALYFSSNNIELSIGGYDILKTVFNPYTNNWTTPINLGLPMNSAGDETHFRLTRDGYTAYFASSRKDGLGERDLYAAYFFDYLPEMSNALLKPIIPSITPPGVFQSKGTTVQTLRIYPLYFDRKEEITAPRIAILLDSIATYLRQNPTVQLTLTGYSQSELAISSRLFSGVDAAKHVADYLSKKGVSGTSMRIKGAVTLHALATLKGVELFFSDTPNTLNIQYDQPITQRSLDSNTLTYRLHFASTDSIYRGVLVSQLEQPVIELNTLSKGRYLYYGGNYPSFNAAKLARTKIQGVSPMPVRIVPYYKAHLLTREEATKLVDIFPDLKYFLIEEKLE